jgi:hypothetical protein
LLIFTVSIVPKTYFHQWLAHHTDTVGCTQKHTSKACMQPPGFHCGFDELVVTSPFTFADAFLTPPQDSVQLSRSFPISPSPFSASLLHKESRGPPSA